MIKNIVAIYPGRFQPFGKHHAAAFKWLQQQFGSANCYIATSNVVDLPKSPFSFEEKKDIIRHYGFNDHIVQTKQPYKAEEILSKFNPEETAVLFLVGQKDMQEDPRFAMKPRKDGNPSYFQPYDKNKSNLQGFDKHGYLVVAPHVSITIPGFGEMSGTTLRKVLGEKKPRAQKQKIFKDIFGWYDEKTANMIFDKLEAISESKINPIAEMFKKKNQVIKQSISETHTKLFSKNWWSESLELTEAISYDELKGKFKKFVSALRQEGKETKVAFAMLAKAAQGKKTLTDAEKKQIGDQMKDVLKTVGLTALAVLPGGLIAGMIIKLLKAEHYITPSAFMTEAELKPNVWKDFNLASLSKEDMDVLWSMYEDTYSKAGLDFSANDASELQSKYKAVYLEDVDSDTVADAFIIYKPTSFGNKIALLGTNDKKEAKKSMLAQLFKLLKTQGWFIEASMKMEEILSAKSDIDVVTDESIIQGLVGDKGLEMMEDGYYKRKLSKANKLIVKRIYGKPKTSSIREGYVSTLNENAAVFAAMAASSAALASSGKGYGSNDDWSFDPIGWFKDFIRDAKLKRIANRLVQDPEIQKLVKDHTFFDKQNNVIATKNIKGIQSILKTKLNPDEMQYLKYGWGPRLRKAMKLGEGYMSQEQLKKHNAKMEKLKSFLNANVGKSFVYDFNEFPKTVAGIKLYEALLKEGGAGGHMAHPFNINWVNTGKDLIKAFEMSINYLKKGPAAVKIDGVNASIRFVELDGKKQFVMDRGSMKPLDVKGITKDELTDRFGEGHGMIKVGGTVLDIFNESIPKIQIELKKLKLWDNPNIMFNIEYVSGSTNVLAYNKNFLAIHGLLELEQVTPKRRGTNEIEYDEKAMQELLNKLAPAAAKHGYEVVGSIPTKLDGTPDLNSELNKKYTVNYNATKKETKTLNDWLKDAKVPTTEFKTKEGKTVSALSKDVLIKISEGINLEDYVADTKDYQTVIDGFAIYMATMKLGDAVLAKLSSPLGPVSEHEGIVIRDERISNAPFKITGKFILGGLASSFKK